MAEACNTRAIISGRHVELIDTENPIFFGCSGKKKKNKKVYKTELEELITKDQNKRRSIRRTRTEFRRLIRCNESFTSFLTTTFDPKLNLNTNDIKSANRLFNLFTMRIKYKYTYFKYIGVPELQKDTDYHGNIKPGGGHVHYHILSNLKYVGVSKMRKMWKNMGDIEIIRLDKAVDREEYLIKYLNKNIYDERFKNKKKYFTSQDINGPIVLKDIEAYVYMDKNRDKLKLIKEKDYHNEYLGAINHKFFELIF